MTVSRPLAAPPAWAGMALEGRPQRFDTGPANGRNVAQKWGSSSCLRPRLKTRRYWTSSAFAGPQISQETPMGQHLAGMGDEMPQ